MNRKISTLIFDYDGVFVLDEYRGLRTLCPDEAAIENIEKNYYDTALDTELWNELRSHFGISQTNAELVAAYNSEDKFQKDHKEKIFTTVDELTKKYKIALLSNQVQSRTEYLLQNENFGSFSSVFFSSEIGMKKPDEEIFTKVLSGLSEEASACLFIDDAMENIQSASALGFQTLLYEKQSPSMLLNQITQFAAEH
jgi:HAD superfamily hydrolase (TIGR01509 family)